jgi:hypothetical protein
VLSAGGALLDAAIFEIALAAASANIGARLRVTITAATLAFELANSFLSEVGLAFTRFVPPAVRFGGHLSMGDSGTISRWVSRNF